MKKQVTIQHIAKKSGVSPATVSRVMTGRVPVSAELRNLVLSTARALNYNLEETDNRVAIVISSAGLFGYLEQMLTSLLQLMEFRKLRPQVILRSDSEKMDENLFCGIISLDFHDNLGEHWNIHHKLPLVSINTPPCMRENVYSVCSDEAQGISSALEYFYEHGHRRMGMLLFNSLLTSTRRAWLRGTSFDTFLREHPDCSGSWSNIISSEALIQPIGELIAAGTTALLIMSESLPIKTNYVLRGMNVRIPEDLSVIGMELPSVTPFLSPPLTTVGQDFQRIAEESLNMLQAQREGKSVRNIYLPYRFFERYSVKSL